MKQTYTVLGDRIPGKLTLMSFMIFLCGAAIPHKIIFVGQISVAACFVIDFKTDN